MNQAQPPNISQIPKNQAASNNQTRVSSGSSPPLSYYTKVLKKNDRSATPAKQSTGPSQTGEETTEVAANNAQAQSRELSAKRNYPQSNLEESQVAPWMYKPLPEEDILAWTAPSRPFKKRNKKYFSTVATIALLISLILGFAGQFAAITVVIAVAFLAYVLSVVPPQNVNYKITTWGVRVENNLNYWEELGRFWFTQKYEDTLLNIESARFPNRVTMLIGDQDQEVITAILSEVLLNQKPEPTLYEKAASWLQEKIPLEIEE